MYKARFVDDGHALHTSDGVHNLDGILFVCIQLGCNARCMTPPIQPEPAEPETGSNASEEPRDMPLFKPFLRPVNGESRAWGDTVWLRQVLNGLRDEIEEKPVRHGDVLRAVRSAMEKLGEVGQRNFASAEYLDAQGKPRTMIQFSDAVLLNVVAAVGGKVEHQLLHRANVELNRLKKMERSGGFGADNTVLVVEAVRGTGLVVVGAVKPPV